MPEVTPWRYKQPLRAPHRNAPKRLRGGSIPRPDRRKVSAGRLFLRVVSGGAACAQLLPEALFQVPQVGDGGGKLLVRHRFWRP